MAEIALYLDNAAGLQLRACQVLMFVRENLDAVLDICRAVANGGHIGSAQSRALMVWQSTEARLSHWQRSSTPWLNDLTDFDDFLARFSRATRPVPKTGSLYLAGKVNKFYAPRKTPDRTRPEDEPMERPLRDLILDLWHHVGYQADAQVVVDYGAGHGRTRHFFYRMAGQDKRQLGAIASRLAYCLVDVEKSVADIQGNATFPNGEHVPKNNDLKKGESRSQYLPCNCPRFSSKDALIVIDPASASRVTRTYPLISTALDSDVWHGGRQGGVLPRSRDFLLVNVLHEVPGDALPNLLGNLLHIVPVGGVVFLYELQQIPSLEENYVVWHPEDIQGLFNELGFAVVWFAGRIHKGETRLGYLYTSAAMIRTQKTRLAKRAIEAAVRTLYFKRSDSLRRRIETLTHKLKGTLVTDATRIEHFDAVHSLVNAYRQSHSWNERSV
jgi:hypothetical protein